MRTDKARVAHRRRFALPVLCQVAEVVLDRVGEGAPRPHHARQDAALGLVEDVRASTPRRVRLVK